MYDFNTHNARRVLAGLPLTPSLRRYADYWLASLGADGAPCDSGFDPLVVDEIMRNVVRF